MNPPEELSPMFFKLRKKLKSDPQNLCPLEQILSKKLGGDNILYYEVKWRNSPSPSWEPFDKLAIYREILDKFDISYSRKENRLKIMQQDEKSIKRIKTKPSQRENPMKIEQTEGRFELGDKAKEILLAKIVTDEETKVKEIFCLVEWQQRNTGNTPLCTLISTKELRKFEPVMLINFYEKKVVFRPSPINLNRTEELYKLYFEHK